MECFKRCPFSPASHSLIFKTPMSPSISVFCLQCVCCSLSIQLLHVTVSAPYHLLEFTLTGPPLCALLSRGYFVLFNGIPTSAAIRTSCTSARPALQVFTSQKHCMQFTFQYFLYSFLFVGMLSFHQLMCGSAAIISFTIQDKISIDIAVPDYQTQLQLKVMCT